MIALFAFVLGLMPTLARAEAAVLPELNQRVLNFCNANLGRSVGSGQCAALAVQALHAAGARPKAAKGYPAWNDYVWGREVCRIEGSPDGTKVASGALSDVLPGDVAQFSQVHFIKMHAAHHTAIVDFIDSKRLGLIHQNIGGHGGPVFKASVRVDKLMTGWIRFYRPVQ